MPLSISLHFNPPFFFLNVLWQIGSSECSVVFVSTMINWCNVDTSPKEHRNLEKWHWKHLRFPPGERLVGILGTVSMRRGGNPLPACSAPAIYRQYMKYGSYLVEGKMPRDFISCVIHVMAESERDGNDCLWDYGGMRNHHKSNLFMLPAVVRVFSWPDYCICGWNHCWVFPSVTPVDLFTWSMFWDERT